MGTIHSSRARVRDGVKRRTSVMRSLGCAISSRICHDGVAMSFERHHEPLLPRHLLLMRMALWSIGAGAVILGSLAIGVCGYHFLEGERWIDALLNASM